MATPVDAGRAVTQVASAGDPWTVNLPGSIADGDGLLIAARCDGPAVFNTPTGWSSIFSSAADASDDTLQIWARDADGTEGASLSLDLTASAKGVAIAWRFTGAGLIATWEVSAVATGTTSPVNPPSLTPAGGSDDWLWLAIGSCEGEQATTTAPADYSNWQHASSSNAGAVDTNCRIFGGTKGTTGTTTEDPGTIAISVNDDWMAVTIAIPPLVIPDVEQPHLNEPNMVVEQAVRRAFQARKY